ncbi:hypothetical protein AWN88_00945 [Agrobacterium tumefaciens]|nr:hypothetical protein AWN88_00225 [Agrobacterium tumefaciens]AMD56881.1 hypothetical protein AWN88_00945 [Agrobacterium tumefaciens]KAJ32317.1 hypothetical protein BW45_24280 [Agrobacterium tumefaciens]
MTVLGKRLVAVQRQLQEGQLVLLLEDHVIATKQMSAVWPTSRQLSPRVRTLVDFLAERLKTFGM